jgi:hypothetical protein
MARVLGSILTTLVLLIVELALTIAVYTSLNVYSFDLFGQLVRFAGSVLELTTSLVQRFFEGSSNSAYASLFGELGPKAMLLLLIGLVVAAIVRLLTSLVSGLSRG